MYVATGYGRFSENKNGIRRISITINNIATSNQVQSNPSNTGVTQLNISQVVNLDADGSILLNLYQTSGETLTVTSGGTFLRIVRIA